jgi:hypothetical protein
VTLIEYPDLIQGSDEWVTARRGIVTASVVGQLITTKTIKPASNEVSRALTRHLVAERITGWTEPTWISADMERGNRDEPIARDLYSEHYAEVTELGFMVRDFGPHRIGYSPDGLVGSDGLIEVKSRRQKNQLATVLADSVPLDNMAQLQCGLLVSGRKWIDYVSFSGGMALWCKRVYREPKWLEAIFAAVLLFERTAAEMVATYTAAVAGLPMTERVLDLEMIL